MSLEIDDPAPLGRERHRFHPWRERPLTEGQVRILLVTCWSVVAILAVAVAIVVWVIGPTAGPTRWSVGALTALVLAVLIVAGRDAWLDLHSSSSGR